MKNILMILFITLFIVIGGWICLYPSANDPKNLGYLLWKLGICDISVENAVCAMIGDNSRETIIIGKTKTKIEKRFGRLMASEEAPIYFINYCNSLKSPSNEVYLIRNSPWIILFKNGVAVDLILFKGH
jgi:hypothetical protein